MKKIKLTDAEQNEELNAAIEDFKGKELFEVNTLVRLESIEQLMETFQDADLTVLALGASVDESQAEHIKKLGQKPEDFMALTLVTELSYGKDLMAALNNSGLPTYKTDKAKAFEEFMSDESGKNVH